ncbi:MAG: hypothetical protein ABI885_12550 [Gammaproteobacteria bacterium]
MAQYPDLNTLKRRFRNMETFGDEGRPLANLSLDVELPAGTKASVYFRDLETPLLRHIGDAEAVVGCVAWLTNAAVLQALARKRTSIVLQKEDFLRPDRGPLQANWKTERRALYDAIPPIAMPVNWEAGWMEARDKGDETATGVPYESLGMRCIGHEKGPNSAMPRMHHKFLVFLRRLSKSDPRVDCGAWPYKPCAVWTGSFNITRNGNASLDNAIYLEAPRLAVAYCREWGQLVHVSESLDWTSHYAEPEFDFNNGACVS